MLQYKNHRFHGAGISFQFPEKYFYDSDHLINCDDYFYLHSPDNTFGVDIHIYSEPASCRESLQGVLNEMPHIVTVPITDLELNGLTGCYASYHGEYNYYHEIWLGNSTGMINVLIYGDQRVDAIDFRDVLTAIDPVSEL